MSVSFVIETWTACAPGLGTPEDWRSWAAAPRLPQGEAQVALAGVPPLARRRFAPLGRLAAQVSLDLAATAPMADDERVDHPTVFASRYGEAQRCLDLLSEHACGDALSPTAFGLSVHNAIGAMIALVRDDRSRASAVAAGRATAAAGLVEAVALLDDGAPRANLVVYDAPLPPAYAHFHDEPAVPFAWAWTLRRPRAGEPALHLDWLPADAADIADAASPADLPSGLQALWFGLSDAPSLVQRFDGRACRWSRA